MTWPNQDDVAAYIDKLKDHGVSVVEISFLLSVAAQTVYRWWRKAQKIRWRKFYELEKLVNEKVPKKVSPPNETAGSVPAIGAGGSSVTEKTDPANISVSAMCDFCRKRGECSGDKKRFHLSVRCNGFFLEPVQVRAEAPEISEFEKMYELTKVLTISAGEEFRNWHRNLSDDQKAAFKKFRNSKDKLN